MLFPRVSFRISIFCLAAILMMPARFSAAQTRRYQPVQAGAMVRRTVDTLSLDLCYRNVLEKDFNGSYYKIYGIQLMNTAALYLTETLQGMVPGLFTRQTEGGVDDGGVSMWIRGGRSTGGSTITLVDGQERPIGMIAPEEVKEIIILKDAAAVGLYGMRASRGAILVNTKKGYAGKPRVEFSAQLTNQQPLSMVDPLDAAGYARHYNAALRSDGKPPLYSEYDLATYRRHDDPEGHPDVDWLDRYFKTNWWAQRYAFNVTGGTKVNRYFMGLSYQHQPGMFNVSNEQGYNTNNYSDRYTFRADVETNLSATTRLNIDGFGWFRKCNSPYTDDEAIFSLLNRVPANAFPAYYTYDPSMLDQDGNEIAPVNGKIVAGDVYHTNPWGRLNRNGYSTAISMYASLRASLLQELDFILPDLYAKAEVALDTQASTRVARTRSFAYYYPRTEGSWQKTGNDSDISTSVSGNSSVRYLTVNLRLEYSHRFGLNNVSAATFYEQFENSGGTTIPNRVQGVSSYLSWNYNHRFGIDVTGAWQGWYGLPKKGRSGFFPTVSAGWNLTEENFLKRSKQVNYLKIRGSWGHLGNYRGITAFSYMGRMSSEGGVFITGSSMENSLTGYYEMRVDNPDLTFEKSDQADIGIDGKFFRNRLSVTADFFTDRRYDLCADNERISSVMGYNSNISITGNLGSMFTYGYEAGAQWRERFGRALVRAGGTFSCIHTKVLSDGSIIEDYDWLNAVGYPRGRKLGYVMEGIFDNYDEIAASPTQSWSKVKPGDYRYRDVNGDGVINSNDRVPIGYSSIPDIYYSFNAGLTYRQWGLSILFQGAARMSRNLGDTDFQPFESYGNIYAHQLGYWTPENRTATLPRTSLSTANANNNITSTATVCSSDYLRLKRVEITYGIRSGAFGLKKFPRSTAFLSAYNLLTWSALDYKDPEGYSDLGNMPLNRSICAGIRMFFGE